MPFYHAVVAPDLADETTREQIANDVVDVHCGVTGAPRSFVHVLFTDAADGRLDASTVCHVMGTIRSGRTDEQKAALRDGIGDAVARRTGTDRSGVTVATRDIEASFTMEGGALLPEPGSPEEEAWKRGEPVG